jgi:predicted PhzF superfamily epimerase YddE/YHI9
MKKTEEVINMEAYVMDAFSARIFGGNQAGVVPTAPCPMRSCGRSLRR